MGHIGFTDRSSDYDSRTKGVASPARPGSSSVDVFKLFKLIGTVIGTLVLLGGLVWGAAMLAAGTATDDDLEKVKNRIELVEKNDLVQTVILEQINDTLQKIEQKLDKALDK